MLAQRRATRPRGGRPRRHPTRRDHPRCHLAALPYERRWACPVNWSC